MSGSEFPWYRLALIAALAARAPRGRLGRTALMKYAYFLQTLKGVPLGYRFTLYVYGPFDKNVLDDLAYAEVLGAVKVSTVHHPGGYGYQIVPADGAEIVQEEAASFLAEYETAIDWVLREFGHYSPSDLELASTIVYFDREAARSAEQLSVAKAVARVAAVKPHFTPDRVTAEAETLQGRGLLLSVFGAPTEAVTPV